MSFQQRLADADWRGYAKTTATLLENLGVSVIASSLIAMAVLDGETEPGISVTVGLLFAVGLMAMIVGVIGRGALRGS